MDNILSTFSNALADAVARAGRSVVAVNASRRFPAAGVHWSTGTVVTAAHAIKRDAEITITLPDGATAPAALAGIDPGTDIAVFRIEQKDLAVAELGDPATLRTGNLALALGRSADGLLRAALGILNAVGGPWRTWSGGQIEQILRFDGTLYPGFSGGPLVGTDGRIAGINTSGLSRYMPVVIPAATVSRVAEELLAKGRIARPFLGVGMQPVQLPNGDTGVIVISLQPQGPAARAGVLIGDVLTAFDGKAVRDTGDVHAFLSAARVGQTLRASLWRAGASLELEIPLGERPE